MAGNSLIGKQRSLNANETINSFENWKHSILFFISDDPKLARFVDRDDLGVWGAYTEEHRGFTDDENTVAADKRMTRHQKSLKLSVLLGSIANHAQVISHTFITRQALSVDDIFNRLCAYYGFRKTGSLIAGALDFKLEPMESKEALWERIYTFLEGNLLTKSSGIRHEGVKVVIDEQFSPTLLNLAVVIWLSAIHPNLPSIVVQKFATSLREDTLYSIRSEISDSMTALLQELEERDGTVSYSSMKKKKFGGQKYSQKSRRECCLCKAASRPGYETHFLSGCPFLPVDDRKYMSKAKIREVELTSDEDCDDDDDAPSSNSCKVKLSRKKAAAIDRVDIIPSPVLKVNVHSETAEITLDSGAEATLVSEEECTRLGLKVLPTSQQASMADGESPLKTVGEVHFVATKYCEETGRRHKLSVSGLVIKKLNCSILAGMPFLVQNDVYLRPKYKSINIGDCCIIKYSSSRFTKKGISTRAASILKVTRRKCLLPGSSIELQLPPEYHDEVVAVEPRNLKEDGTDWFKSKLAVPKDGSITIVNETDSPVLVNRHDQICQVRHTTDMQPADEYAPKPVKVKSQVEVNPATLVSVDPHNLLSEESKAKFIETNNKHKEVFSSKLGEYNGEAGKFEHIINMGESLPPQRKGKVPMYNRSNLELLQNKFDELYKEGVFARPEDLNISLENVSPSFLLAKSSGGTRLVTSFVEIGQYAKPQPSMLPKVEDVLRHIGQWKWIIQADLKSAYYQIKLAKESMKYAGVCTPFRGVLVYTRAVMGLPGSESALEQLLCKILGDLMLQGSVAKLADDLYLGADTLEELNEVWDTALTLLEKCGMKLSPQKTVICPKSTVILGWTWEQGKLSATPHRLNTLAACTPPSTVKELRSFIGSFKYLSNVLPRHSDVLQPLDKLCAGNNSNDKIVWTTELEDAFENAKAHLKEAKTLTLPRREDKLQITTDAAASTSGLAAAMYVIRDKPYLAGVFNARKSGSQAGWLICELEALAIGASVNHFSPYIIQSNHTTEVLTDSRPCVQAYGKLTRGAFSASSRVTTFLSAIHKYHVKVAHIPGKDNVASDYLSRNPLPCDGECQICKFVAKLEHSVVQQISVQDVVSGRASVPYTTRSTWIKAQAECKDLKQVYKLLKDGRTPSKKKRGITDVRRYLQKVKIS